MKTIAILLTAMLLSGGVAAQGISTESGAGLNAPQSKKEKQEALRAKMFEENMALVRSKRFALEADYLSNQYGFRSVVTPDLNFILVDSAQAVIQTGRNNGFGYNGVGGVTAKGKITSWNVVNNTKNKTTTVEMNVSTPIGFFSVFMNITANGKARATLSGIWRGHLDYEGYLVPLDKSYAYEGNSL